MTYHIDAISDYPADTPAAYKKRRTSVGEFRVIARVELMGRSTITPVVVGDLVIYTDRIRLSIYRGFELSSGLG